LLDDEERVDFTVARHRLVAEIKASVFWLSVHEGCHIDRDLAGRLFAAHCRVDELNLTFLALVLVVTPVEVRYAMETEIQCVSARMLVYFKSRADVCLRASDPL